VTPLFPTQAAQRAIAMVDLAMFDAVNAIERRYRPYIPQDPAPALASKEAAAAAAAGAVLASFAPADSKAGAEIRQASAAYLAAIPDGEAKSAGLKVGEAAARKILEARAKDGSDAPDAYRPKTKPGVYVATTPTVASSWAEVMPFGIAKTAQFRPPPPPALDSPEFAASYNELREYGGRVGSKRSPEQTETARFWLMTGPQAYHPFVRQLAMKSDLSVVDCARLMALTSMALADAYMAVFDAKYHYEFWRPITAIRNGDTTGNPNTPRDATWQPIDNTPMHPEYPCAHCIVSGALAGVLTTLRGGTTEVPQITMTSVTAPGVTHSWTNLDGLTKEVAQARIWAGFHYRFSTVVGTDMGQQIGRYVAENALKPVN
jgi:hypothetical protein